MKKQAKEQPREQHPTVEGKVFAVVCKGCDFKKLRRHFSDARWFQTRHEKKDHEVSIDQIDEPKKPAKSSTKKRAKMEQGK